VWYVPPKKACLTQGKSAVGNYRGRQLSRLLAVKLENQHVLFTVLYSVRNNKNKKGQSSLS
jgi:hypothetical protein